MNDVYFKASLQNTLNPEVGTFDNVGNKGGIFTLEDGEYYLTNNIGTSYRVYYPTKDIIYSVGFTTVEFDINYRSSYSSLNSWCLLFNGSDADWHGFGCSDSTLRFLSNKFNYEIVTSPNTWLHVKCIFDYNYDLNQNIVHIYINNVEVKNFTISNIHDIKYIDILGNSKGYVANAKIKNITIRNSKKHYLDIIGLTSLWSKIKSIFATKTELASKANTSDLATVATSGNFNDLINKPDIRVEDDGSLYVERSTDGNFFKFTHTEWSTSGSDAWGGMYFQTSDDRDVFGFAARQSTWSFEKFTAGNNGYLRGYDTEGNRTVSLVINGGTYNEPDTQNITVDGLFINAGDQKPYSANEYTIGTSDMPYKSMYAGTFNTASPSGNSGLIASKSNTGYSLLFGIGSTGVNRGIYDKKNSCWPVFLDDTDYIMTQCPTPPEGDSSNKLATTEWVQNELAKLRQALRDIQNPENPENPENP